MSWICERNDSRRDESVTGLPVVFVAKVDKLDDGDSEETKKDVLVGLLDGWVLVS